MRATVEGEQTPVLAVTVLAKLMDLRPELHYSPTVVSTTKVRE